MSKTDPIFHSLGIIEKRIQEKLTVESLAESSHLSQFHYQRLFREAVGESVMRYVTRRRLSLAAGELAGTDLSVLEIALKYGYDSHEGFTRSFRAHMGVTPTEYRRHHAFVAPINVQKERSAMTYSKAADDIIRELNGLIIQARETAARTRERPDSQPVPAFYAPFWEFIAAQAEAMAEELSAALSRVTTLPQQPEGIFARFRIVKAIEDTVFRAHITAFQARLTACRARPEDRAALGPLCARYDALARRAQIGSGNIAAFFRELAALIFRDMRENAQSLLDRAVKTGKAAYEAILADPALPYGYIGEEVGHIANELAAVPLEQMTATLLEETLENSIPVSLASNASLENKDKETFESAQNFGREHILSLLHTLAYFPKGSSLDFPAYLGTRGEIFPSTDIQIVTPYLCEEVYDYARAAMREDKRVTIFLVGFAPSSLPDDIEINILRELAVMQDEANGVPQKEAAAGR